MSNTNSELELLTQQYWHLSSIWNGRIASRISTGEFLKKTTEIVIVLNPTRNIVGRTLCLENEVVRGDKADTDSQCKVIKAFNR